ncbi:MAG: deoxynucleoside kinase [Gammaproteobacteria bacterium]|jgi:deoxyadenosine/deoxycytidine kinase|nr:deoxynucleoside kinase [Gammaproteobacteria bacterium]
MSSELRHDYIVVEGPIGVGKTSLARRLAATFETELLLEGADENPFLERFYRNPREAALPTQLYFLFQRARQMQALRQGDIFRPVRVADFLMEKDRLFAGLTLDDEELKLYEQVYAQMTLDAPTPDLVIYLQAPVDILRTRVRSRGIPHEQLMDQMYLEKVVDAYARLFHYYDAAPLLIVNASSIDPLHNDEDYEALLACIRGISSGRHFFNPVPSVLQNPRPRQ